MLDSKNAALFGALIGALIALAGVVITQIAAVIRERRQFSREKGWRMYEDERANIERIYSVVEEFRESYSGSWVSTLKSLGLGRLETDKGIPIVPWAKLRMLIGLYAPEMNDALQRLVSPTKAYSQLLVEMVAGFRDDGTLSPTLPPGWRMEMLEKLTAGGTAISLELDAALDALRVKAAKWRQQAGEVARLK
jgi:hypothetical protein